MYYVKSCLIITNLSVTNLSVTNSRVTNLSASNLKVTYLNHFMIFIESLILRILSQIRASF